MDSPPPHMDPKSLPRTKSWQHHHSLKTSSCSIRQKANPKKLSYINVKPAEVWSHLRREAMPRYRSLCCWGPRNGRCPNSHNRFAQEDVNHRWQSSIPCCCCLSPRHTWLIFEGELRMISDVSKRHLLESILCAHSIYTYVARYCTLPRFNYLSINVVTYTAQTQLTSILIRWPSKLGVKSFQLRAMWATTYVYLRKCSQHGLQN